MGRRRNGEELEPMYAHQVMRRRPMPASIQREADRAVGIEDACGAAWSANIRNYRRVASEGLEAVAELSFEEAVYTRRLPHAAARFQTLVDIFSMNIANKVTDAGRD